MDPELAPDVEDHGRALTRRRLIGGAAASGAGYALAGAVPAWARRRRNVEVIVIGAGLAGLSAARELKRRGHSFVVLEARERVGGRTWNRPVRGTHEVVEIGGQWVGPTQDRVLALIDALGLDTYKTYIDGSNVYYRAGTKTTYTGTIPPANPASLVELQLVITKLDQMAAQVPPDAPWTSASASEWDGQTFETWKLANALTPEARDLVDLAIASVFACEPSDISLLHVLFYIRAAGSFENLINTTAGAQESRIVGGSQLISRRMAKKLGRHHVVLRAPARVIKQGRRGVTVVTPKGHWHGKRVIVAMAPVMTSRIRYRPKLPAERDQLTQRVPMGSVIKCMAVYSTPFWRADGLSGMATSDTGPVKLTFDNSPPDGKPGVLLGFIEGQEAREWTKRSRKARRAAVLESFERYYGSRARTDAKQYLEKSWAEDPWARGCYGGYMPPGVLTGYGPELRRPVGRLHWAGTETATIWNGYMDGAVQSGVRAADEVIARL